MRSAQAILLAVTALWSIAAQTALATPLWGQPKRHFIVLVQANSEMKKKNPERVPSLIASGMFDGSLAQRFKFDPNNDVMSLAFFSLSTQPAGDPASCKAQSSDSSERSGSVLAAPYLFHWVNARWSPNREQLQQVLQSTVDEACTFVEENAPKTSVWELALPDISARLDRTHDQFDEVIIVDVSILATFGDPTEELDQLRQRYSTGGLEKARQTIGDVLKAFHIDDSLLLVQRNEGLAGDWRILPPGANQSSYLEQVAATKIKAYPITMRFLRVLPASEPDVLLAVPPVIRLSPEAVSSGQVRVLGDPYGVRVANTSSWPLQSVVWDAGDPSAPTLSATEGTATSRVIDVSNCPVEACRLDGAAWAFPLWAGVGLPQRISAHGSELASGTVRFGAAFRYRSGRTYGHLMRRIGPVPIRVETASPPVVNNGIFPSRALTIADPAREWRPSDGTTDWRTAAARIEASRTTWTWVLIVLGAASAVALAFLAWFLLPGRGFRPHFRWQALSDPIVVDFNDTSNQIILLGTLILENESQPDPLSQLARKTQQPRHQMSLAIDGSKFGESKLVLKDSGTASLIGFAGHGEPDISGTKQDAGILVPTWSGRAVDGQEFLLFLACDRIRDFKGDADNGPARLDLKVLFAAAWNSRWSHTLDRSTVFETKIKIEVRPKEAARPVVRFAPRTGPAYYHTGPVPTDGDVALGAYVFRSPETLGFSKTFQGEFDLSGELAGRAATASALSLQSRQVTLRPGQERINQVIVHCASPDVANPEPPSHRAVFSCLGPAAHDSDLSSRTVELLRDPAKSRLDMTLNKDWFSATDTGRRIGRQVYWTEDGALRWRWAERATDIDSLAVDAKLALEQRSVKFQRDERIPRIVMTLGLANAARNGRGRIEVTIKPDLVLADAYRQVIRDARNRLINPRSIVEAVDAGTREAVPNPIVLCEGDAEKNIDIVFNIADIVDVADAYIPSMAASLLVAVEARIWTDADAAKSSPSERRSSTFATPLEIELLPPDTWLCIDFGTSAISVARMDESGELVVSDLQNVPQKRADNKPWSLAKYDTNNAEIGTHFLPSSIVFDADLRSDASSSQGYPGFPQFAPASLTPGDPSFVSLPARSIKPPELEGRIVYSLKSWFGAGSEHIVLESPVQMLLPGAEAPDLHDRVPTRDAMISTLSALAEAYIKPDRADAGHVVLTHPNTLTGVHIERLVEIGRSALGPSLGIPRPDRLTLVSESDAVAYHYANRMRRSLPPAQDTLLVYDFGAGTLDLSIVRIGWEIRTVPQPVRWQTLARVGVPVAGNHFDMLIAAALHKALVDPNQIDTEFWGYQYPIVADKLVQSGPTDQAHRRAIVEEVWPAIREAKHLLKEDENLDGSGEFVVRIRTSEESREGSVLRPRHESGTKLDPGKPAARQSDDAKKELEIAIPCRQLFGDPGIGRFTEFVTKEVVRETLAMADVAASDITSVMISGRGALWPGLRKAIWEQFENADKPDLLVDGVSEDMKTAVVQGAIEFQRIVRHGWLKRDDTRARPRLVVVFEQAGRKVMLDEEVWGGKTINVGGTHGGTIYQVSLAKPDPSDFESYRRYFYSRVPESEELFRDTFAVDGMLTLTREDAPGGSYVVTAVNRDRNVVKLAPNISGRHDVVASRPDWPVGSPIIRLKDLL